MNTLPLKVAINDTCDLGAIRTLLDCVRDRDPRIVSGSKYGGYFFADLNWTYADSPKREAQMEISTTDAGGVRVGKPPIARAMALTILERAMEDHLTIEDLIGWRKGLKELALHAALMHHERHPEIPLEGHYSASADTPWRTATAVRMESTRPTTVVRTMHEDEIRRLLPKLPPIVLVQSASMGRRGGARISVTSMRGVDMFTDMNAVERLRALTRFS